MPCKIKVKVLAGRNLPVMDRAGDTTDAFVEIKFGGVTHKTDVCRKSLNPHWSSTEWYRFEVDESELQDEPLQLRLMDHDTYSANDAIGKVVVSLAPLLAREQAQNIKSATAGHTGAMLSGWIPVFDTMHGIRGELNIIVKVELFSDFNKYKTSSCGVQFFHCPSIPPGYRCSSIHGFVEELVVNDDPEYQWIDKIRTPRASNEARQVAFIKLSNQVQRLVGLKAAELGANAVVGYQQDFDLEGEAGVVARAIGTAVSITLVPTPSLSLTMPPCSQHQLKKLLDILTPDRESLTDLNEYFTKHQDELQKLIHILHPNVSPIFMDDTENPEDDKFLLSRQASIKSYVDNVSIYQDDYPSQQSLKTISDDQTDLNKLLNRIDDDFDNESQGPLQRLKKMKPFFNRFTMRKKKTKHAEQKKNEDQISIKSFSSDTSMISLSDIKNEITKFKRLKKLKFRKRYAGNDVEGEGMVSILARSVIHAHTSLACIAEKDSEYSPNSTMRRVSESDPIINELLQTESEVKQTVLNIKDSKAKTPETSSSLQTLSKNKDRDSERKSSESCPSTPVTKRVDNVLKLPGDYSYFGSVSSALSGESSEEFTSSDEEDESSDLKTDTDRSIETTSAVVQIVLGKEIDPALIAHMDRKLSVLENKTPEPPEKHEALTDVIEKTVTVSKKNYDTDIVNNETEINVETQDVKNEASSAVPVMETKKSNSFHHFKFHNPFSHSKSISAPSSPNERQNIVSRSSKSLKSKISKISKSSLIKGLSHYSLTYKKKHTEPTTLRRNSHSDASSKTPSHETVLGSPFLSYTDLLSLDKEEHEVQHYKPEEASHKSSCVKMYIGSEPVSRASVSGPSSPSYKEEHPFKHCKKEKNEVKPTGLIHTAMETILIDKVHSLLIPTSPEPSQEKKFFNDVNEKLELFEESKKKTLVEKSKESDVLFEKSRKRESMEDTENNNVLIEEHKQSDPSLSQNLIEDKHKKLVRQDSIHSIESGQNSRRTSSAQDIQPPVLPSPPMLQHFHPILSGIAKSLETIPSLPEDNSLDRTQSIDNDGVISDTNSVLCDNSHGLAVTVVGRSEKDKENRKSPTHARHESCGSKEQQQQQASLNATSTPVGMHRRSSDSDLSITPKGGSLNTSVNAGSGGGAILRPSMNSNNLDMLEYPFLTMSEFPVGFLVHLGGTVCARSVKLADASGGGEREAWWAELRTELRAHARALRCNAVVAYTETTAICEDICVLSASGTAAVINLDCDLNAELDASLTAQNNSKAAVEENDSDYCCVAHVPYSPGLGPYRAELSACGTCRRSRVPTVLLATCEKPQKLVSCSKAITLTAVAARVRRAQPQSEPGARDISDQLPFLEYELHKLLLAKLRMQGANALFNLRTQISIGERFVMSLASGTAVRLGALPPPTPPRIKATENDKDALEIQKALWDTFTANRAANGFDNIPGGLESSSHSTVEEVEEEGPPLDLTADKDACVLELDEAEDVETARALSEHRVMLPILNREMKTTKYATPCSFVQFCRGRFLSPVSSSAGRVTGLVEKLFTHALDSATYKLRKLRPAALSLTNFQLDQSEDEIQLVLSGAGTSLLDPSKPEPQTFTSRYSSQDGDDDIFSMDEDHKQPAKEVPPPPPVEDQSGFVPTYVSLTTQSEVFGARRERRVCALRLLFVRETTAVRELGGISGFLHTFTCEVISIVRAYTAALGGNTLTSFYLRQLMMQDNAHKNQGQCLVSVGGDVVHITF